MTSPGRFLAAALAVYVLAISGGIVLFLVFRDSLEDLAQQLRWWVAERRRQAPSRRVPRPRLRLLLWEPIAVRVGVERRLRRRLSRARPTTTAATRTPGRNRLAWAVPAVVAVVAAIALVATHDFGSGSRSGAGASAKLQALPWNVDQLLRPPPVSSTRTAVAHAGSGSPNRATSQSARSAPPTQQTPLQHTPVVHTTVVSNLQPVSEHTAPAAGKTSAATTSHGGGLTPLQAPKAAPPPSPLKAP